MSKFNAVFMTIFSKSLLLLGIFFTLAGTAQTKGAFINAADFGFLPTETGVNNKKALQAAVDHGGTITVSKTGTYKLAGTVYLGDNTSLEFGNGVFIQKVKEPNAFGYVFLNKGALTKTFNYHIAITGLNLLVNNVDTWMGEVYGDRGHISFIWVKDLKIEHFRCLDLAAGQFCIQVCTFENLLINDVIIKGKKDGIHLGRGKRFRISNCVFETADDAIALAAGDWISGNPEFGDIEDGIIENCYDLSIDKFDGAFAKIVPSAWIDWKQGMDVRHGDAVVSSGKIYRVLAPIDGKIYKSVTPPTFSEESKIIDGIKWMNHQTDTFHTAVVRNVIFRDIFLESKRVPFQIICYNNDYSHSYYNGAPTPVQSEITLENIHVLNDFSKTFINIASPLDMITIRNSTFKNSGIVISSGGNYPDVKTNIKIENCNFKHSGDFTLLKNNVDGKQVYLKTSGSIETGENFSAKVVAGNGKIHVDSDLTGLK